VHLVIHRRTSSCWISIHFLAAAVSTERDIVIVAGRFVPRSGAGSPFQDLPVFDCFISIPTFGCANTVALLFDSGSDQTAIMPHMGNILNVPYARLSFPQASGGIITGAYCDVPATVSFRDTVGNFKNYNIPIAIFDPAHFAGINYSVLGRDICHNWRLLYDFPRRRLWARM
jgi:hypothetical protein